MDVGDLQGLAIFAGLSDDDAGRVAHAASARTYPAGGDVIVMGQVTDAFFVILSGTARVSRDGAVIATLAEGNFFGEAGALATPGHASARNATVTAATELTVAVLPGDRFTDLVARIPEFRAQIAAAMRAR